MAEYICREEAIKELRKVYEDEYPTASGDFDEYASHDVPNVLRNMPSADVQPVKRGKWIEIAGYGGWGDTSYTCSECETTEYIKSSFCPWCGADLRRWGNG